MDSKFDYGEKVRVIRNIRNDGTFMGKKRGELLIRRGSEGFIKGMGRFLQEQIVYQVHFIDQNLTVGCREVELSDLESPWIDRKFERNDPVIVGTSLSSEGTIVVAEGDRGVILSLESDEKPYYYKVNFPRKETGEPNAWLVPESVLTFDPTLPEPIKPLAMLKRSAECK